MTSSVEEVFAGLVTSREALAGALSSLTAAREELAGAARALAETLPEREAERLGARFAGTAERIERLEEKLGRVDAAVEAFAASL